MTEKSTHEMMMAVAVWLGWGDEGHGLGQFHKNDLLVNGCEYAIVKKLREIHYYFEIGTSFDGFTVRAASVASSIHGSLVNLKCQTMAHALTLLAYAIIKHDKPLYLTEEHFKFFTQEEQCPKD